MHKAFKQNNQNSFLMVRFGKYCVYDKNLSFLGKMGYFIHGNPHIAKFIQSRCFKSKIKTIISNNDFNVLDVGCGSGDYAFYLAQKYPCLKIDAIDANKSNIEFAKEIKQKSSLKSINFSNKSLGEFSNKNKYDFIYCVEVLHAVDDKARFINKISTLLSKDGFFYFQDCLSCSFEEYNLFVPLPFKKYQLHYFKGFQLSESKLCDLIKKSGLEIISKSYFFGFFGRLAWEIDQKFQTIRIGHVRTFLIPFFKFFCILDSLIPIGKMEEIAIIAKKIK